MIENPATDPVAASDPGAVPGAPAPARAKKPRREGRRARVASSAPVLGVHVTAGAIHAVLMRAAGEGFEPIRQFSRQRSNGATAGAEASQFAYEQALAGGAASGDGEAGDVTIQFGEGHGGADLFMESEFGALGVNEGKDLGAVAGPRREAAQPVVFELKDLIEECRAAGFDKPALAFCVGAPDVDYVEITVTPEADKKEKKAKKGKDGQPEPVRTAAPAANAPIKRERLLALVPRGDTPYDLSRAAFIPMTPRDQLRRFLAVLPRPEEPIAPSLSLLREQAGMRRIPFRGMDAEVPTLVGMVRLAFPTDAHENTAIVRVGTEDTLVVLLAGDQLHHCDHMRSVTMFDGPDTICSRVLLQQDVQGIGTVHNVVVVSEEREDELVQGFAAFYPEARVGTLRAGMARLGVAGPYGPLPAQVMIPTGAAIKALMKRGSTFDDVNLLPKQLKRTHSRPALAFSWHTLVAGVLLFLSVLFFMGLYFSQQSDIAEAEQRLAEYPPEMLMSTGELQAKIDSLTQLHTRITTSLITLDSLLIGSDQWSQTLARTTRAAAGVGGLWVEDWEPGPQEVLLHGFATGRANVVSLAERLGGSIESVVFSDIRAFPVYEYRVRFAVPNEMPLVATYLREQAEQNIPAVASDPEPLSDRVSLPAGR